MAGAMPLRPPVFGTTTLLTFFQNVAADGGVHLLGQCAQQLPKGRGAVGNGDRLRAAGRRDKLFAQDVKIICRIDCSSMLPAPYIGILETPVQCLLS